MVDPTKFIGRKAAACRKCGGGPGSPSSPQATHYVNRMGGIVCLTCSPPSSAADCLLRLEISGGEWNSGDHGFDHGLDVPASNPAVSATAAPQRSAAAGRSTEREAAYRQFIDERADHVFTADEAEWGWYDPSWIWKFNERFFGSSGAPLLVELKPSGVPAEAGECQK